MQNKSLKTGVPNAKSKKAISLLAMIVAIACVVCAAYFGLITSPDTDGVVSIRDSLVAEAAEAADLNPNSFDTTIRKTYNGKSSKYALQGDVTLSSVDASEITFEGELDGNGHTITIEGNKTINLGTADSQVDHYAGLIVGTLKGTFKNLNIVLSGNYYVQSTNSVKTSGKPYDGGKNTTLYAGIICGKASDNAFFDNVKLTIAEGASFTARGIDGSDSYGTGNGGVAGGFIARSEGAIIDSCTFETHGIIHAVGENRQAGERVYTGGSGSNKVYVWNECGAIDHPCRAVAGGLVGEIYGSSSTDFYDITILGNGGIGAYVAGNTATTADGGSGKALKSNCAGLVVGFSYTNTASFNIYGMIYNFTGVVYVSRKNNEDIQCSGLIAGHCNNGAHVLNSYWRNTNDSSNTSGTRIYDPGSTSTPSLLAVNTGKTTIGTGTLSSLATMKNGGNSSITKINAKEYEPYLQYRNTQSSSYGSFVINSISKRALNITATTASDSYIISSVLYKSSNNKSTYDNKYSLDTREVQFTSIYSLTDTLIFYVATKDTTMWTTYTAANSSKTFDASGFAFQGAPIENGSLAPTMSWGVVYCGTIDKRLDDDECTLKHKFSTPPTGFGLNSITTNSNCGIYRVVLYKQDDSDERGYSEAKAGDIFGPNQQNAPYIIYTYSEPTQPYEFKITPLEIKIVQKEGARISKTYDGKSSVDVANILPETHYNFARYSTGSLDLPSVKPSLVIGVDSYFSYADSNVPATDVNNPETNPLDVHITGCSLPYNDDDSNHDANYNYRLAGGTEFVFKNCYITPFQIELDWADLVLTYNGESQKPTATPKGIDTFTSQGIPVAVNIEILTYISQSYYNNTVDPQPIDAIDVKNDYYAVARISQEGGSTSNFKIDNSDSNIVERKFNIIKKRIGVDWSGLDLIFNTEAQTVTYAIKSDALTSRDKDVNEDGVPLVDLDIAYFDLETSAVTSCINAGSYYAEASLTGDRSGNYELDDTFTSGEITIAPMEIEFGFHTGAGDDIQPLKYIGTNYIGHDSGLHASIIASGNTGLTVKNIMLRYYSADGTTPTTKATDVGTYWAEAELTNSEDNPIFTSNYRIADSAITKVSFNIIRKVIRLNFEEVEKAFVYDGTEKCPSTPTVKNAQTEIYTANGDIVNIFTKKYDSDGNELNSSPIDVGSYYLTFYLKHACYEIYEKDLSFAFKITPYDISLSSIEITIASSVQYAGVPQCPVPTVSFNGSTLIRDIDYTVTYENNTKVGTNTATASITGSGNFMSIKTVKFSITPKVLKVVFDNSESTAVYNGYGHVIHPTATDQVASETAPALKVIYYNSEGESSETPPSWVGTYSAVAAFKSSQSNYVLPTPTGDYNPLLFRYTITPKAISIKFAFATPNDGLIFDGFAHKVNASWANNDDLCADDHLKVSINNIIYTNSAGNTIEAPIIAGRYTATAQFKGDDTLNNYTIVGNMSTAFTIKQRDIIVSISDLDAEYDSENKKPEYSIQNSEDIVSEYSNVSIVMTYYKNSKQVQSATDVGQYTVSLSYGGEHKANYNLVSASNPGQRPEANITIYPAELKVTLNQPDITLYQGVAYEYKAYTIHVDNDKLKDKVADLKLSITFNLLENGTTTVVNELRNAGTYKIVATLPENSNYVCDLANSTLELTHTIAKRKIAYETLPKTNPSYNGENHTVTAVPSGSTGAINSDYMTTGLVDGETADVLNFRLVITDSNGIEVEHVRNVGVYNIAVYLDSGNYELNDTPTRPTIVEVTPKEISFAAKEITKAYGNRDNAEDFKQLLGTDVTGTNESIWVTLKREQGLTYEMVGEYDYKNEVDIDGDYDNYRITLNADSHKFIITKRNVTPSAPQVFRKDYGRSDPILTQTALVATEVFGEIHILITYQRISGSEDKGTYDLDPTPGNYSLACVEYDIENFNIYINPENLKGKFIIDGLGVVVKLDRAQLVTTYTPMSQSPVEPVFENFIVSVAYENCADNIRIPCEEYVAANGSLEGFNWSDYIRITRVKPDNTTSFFYRDGGYPLTITFLKGDKFTEDENYRAILPIDETEPYVYTINKLDLNGLLPTPVLSGSYIDSETGATMVKKAYDGTTKITITAANANIPIEFANESLSVYANFENANAGTNKHIIITYKFDSKSYYANNYILPEPSYYSIEGNEIMGQITPLTLSVALSLTSNEITYGSIPEANITISGFIADESKEVIDSIRLQAIYAVDGSNLNVLKNVSEEYLIKLALVSGGDNPNYIIDYNNVTAHLKINRKQINVVAGAPYSKPVDGSTSTPDFGPSNYAISGLLDKDANLVDILYTTVLSGSEPGNSTVTVSVTQLTGDTFIKENYELSNTIFTVPATILKLANVIMSNATFDYDTTPKSIVPILTDKYNDRISYKLEYTGTDYPTSESAPIDAGEYIVRCYVIMDNETSTYIRYETQSFLRIEKITPTIYFDGDFTQTYGTFTPIKAVVKAIGLNESVDVEYSFANNGVMPDFVPAGKFTVSAYYNSTKNYTAASLDHDLEIVKKKLTVKFSGYENLVYNGLDRSLTDEIKVTFDGVVEGDTCLANKKFSPQVVKNAGEYFLEVFPMNNNYITNGNISIMFSISKKQLLVSASANPTMAGTSPVFDIKYDGFVDNDDVNDLEHAPTINLSAGSQVGSNKVVFINGSDTNYEFVYADCVYVVTYEPKENQDKKNVTVPIIVIGSVLGGAGVVAGLGFGVKTMVFRSMYNVGAVKRRIRGSRAKRK